MTAPGFPPGICRSPSSRGRASIPHPRTTPEKPFNKGCPRLRAAPSSAPLPMNAAGREKSGCVGCGPAGLAGSVTWAADGSRHLPGAPGTGAGRSLLRASPGWACAPGAGRFSVSALGEEAAGNLPFLRTWSCPDPSVFGVEESGRQGERSSQQHNLWEGDAE